MLNRTRSTFVPDHSLRELVKAYADATDDADLKAQLADKTLSVIDLKKSFVAQLKQTIKGTPTQALIIDTISVFTSATATVAISPAVNTMTELNGSLKNILAGSPSLSAALLTLPTGMRYDHSGGKAEFLALRAIAILGILGYITLSASTDLSTVNSFDGRFVGMLCLSLLVGSTTASFLVINNLIQWYPSNKIGTATGIYGGIGNLAPGLFLLVLQLTLKQLGLPLAFGLSAVTLSIGTGVMAAFYRATPYHQLKKKGLSHNHAAATAKLLGQERFPLPPDINYLKLLKETAFDLRALTLSLTSSSYGIFLTSTISLYIMLTDSLKLSTTQAVLVTSAGSIWSTLIRPPIGKCIDKFDKSGGIYTFSIANLLTIAGALMTAIPKPLPNFIYTAAAQTLIFTGSGAGSTASIAMLAQWSTPKNQHSNHFNIGTMSGITASIGTLWGLLLPLANAGFVWKQGNDGYQNFFYFIAALSLLATTMTLLTQQHLNKPLQQSTHNCFATLFRQHPARQNRENALELGNVNNIPPKSNASQRKIRRRKKRSEQSMQRSMR